MCRRIVSVLKNEAIVFPRSPSAIKSNVKSDVSTYAPFSRRGITRSWRASAATISIASLPSSSHPFFR